MGLTLHPVTRPFVAPPISASHPTCGHLWAHDPLPPDVLPSRRLDDIRLRRGRITRGDTCSLSPPRGPRYPPAFAFTRVPRPGRFPAPATINGSPSHHENHPRCKETIPSVVPHHMVDQPRSASPHQWWTTASTPARNPHPPPPCFPAPAPLSEVLHVIASWS